MEDVNLEPEVSLRAAARAESIGGGQGYLGEIAVETAKQKDLNASRIFWNVIVGAELQKGKFCPVS